jgi:TRAP-type C4-dicarboxylate transport system permease small subunit
MTDALAAAWGRLLVVLLGVACVLLFALMTVVCLDVVLRNVPLIAGMRGVPAANELSEFFLYLITMLSAPWLMRQGQHIRVDILLRAIPGKVAWAMEWCMDIAALACCVITFFYGVQSVIESRAAGSQLLKTFIIPEWWTLVPLPVTFLLLTVEVLFRIHRLQRGPRGPREEAVSAS